MSPSIKLLLRLRRGAAPAALDARLRQEAELIGRRYSGPFTVERADRIHDDDLQRVAAGIIDAVPPFDALFEVRVDGSSLPEGLLTAFEGFADRLEEIVEIAQSVAMAGEEHTVLPGDGSLLVTIVNRRLPNFTREGFLDYWLHNHGDFARKHTPSDVGLGYRQFHVDTAATALLGKLSGISSGDFDGAAVCYYPAEQNIRRLMGMEQIVEEATEDEREFTDHKLSGTSLMRVRLA